MLGIVVCLDSTCLIFAVVPYFSVGAPPSALALELPDAVAPFVAVGWFGGVS